MATRSMRFNRDLNKHLYFLDEREVSKKEWDADWLVKPPDFSKGECPRVRGDLDDFSSENGGRGRFNPQINDYMKNPQDALDKGRAKGYRKIG